MKEKVYKCGKVVMLNTDLIREVLNKKKGEVEYAGIQRSFAYFNRLVYIDGCKGINTVNTLLKGYRTDIEEEDRYISVYEECEFELPLVTKWDTVVGKAIIRGTGKYIGNKNDYDKVEFIIEGVDVVA